MAPSSPIPEDHRESQETGNTSLLAPQVENQEEQTTAPSAASKPSPSHTMVPLTKSASPLDLSDIGMFVSLAGSTLAPPRALSPTSEFHIVDEGRAYSARKQQSRSGVPSKGRNAKIKRKRLPLSEREEVGGDSEVSAGGQPHNVGGRVAVKKGKNIEGDSKEDTGGPPRKATRRGAERKIARRKPTVATSHLDWESSPLDSGSGPQTNRQSDSKDISPPHGDHDQYRSAKIPMATQAEPAYSHSPQIPAPTRPETQQSQSPVHTLCSDTRTQTKQGRGKRTAATDWAVQPSSPVLKDSDPPAAQQAHTTGARKLKEKSKYSRRSEAAQQAPGVEGVKSGGPRLVAKGRPKQKTGKDNVEMVAAASPAMQAHTEQSKQSGKRSKTRAERANIGSKTGPLNIDPANSSIKAGQVKAPKGRNRKGRKTPAESTDAGQAPSPAKKGRRSSPHPNTPIAVHLHNAEEDMCTPTGQSLSIIDIGDSALKSGISFRRFSNVPSSLKIKRSRLLSQCNQVDISDDVIPSPPQVKQGRMSEASSPLMLTQGVGSPRPAHSSSPLTVSQQPAGKTKRTSKAGRRVTICEEATQHHLSPTVDVQEDEERSVSMLPSMSATPVHYHLLSSPFTVPKDTITAKIVHPDDNAAGLRRSKRTRVKPLEWYKNERIIYDRRKSEPVIVAIEPSREQLYLQQERQKRRKRRQNLLMKKKKQAGRGRLAKRLSTHIPVPDSLNTTVSTDIPIVHPDTHTEVLMGCFNPAGRGMAVGPNGGSAGHGKAFSVTLMTDQTLFTTGVLTLAPTCEKPLQRTVSTAVLYFITYGKILVTINQASTILETGDHFFVPRGTVYRLQNLRRDEASLTFANLMLDTTEKSTSSPKQ